MVDLVALVTYSRTVNYHMRACLHVFVIQMKPASYRWRLSWSFRPLEYQSDNSRANRNTYLYRISRWFVSAMMVNKHDILDSISISWQSIMASDHAYFCPRYAQLIYISCLISLPITRGLYGPLIYRPREEYLLFQIAPWDFDFRTTITALFRYIKTLCWIDVPKSSCQIVVSNIHSRFRAWIIMCWMNQGQIDLISNIGFKTEMNWISETGSLHTSINGDESVLLKVTDVR